MASNQVRPPRARPTDTDVRHYLADGLIRACHVEGPARIALEAGCDEKTIRRARDEESMLGFGPVVRLAAHCPDALATVFASVGLKLVPLEGGEAVGQTTASCITKLLLQLSVALEDGRVDDHELAAMRGALDEAGRAIDTMRERLALRAVEG